MHRILRRLLRTIVVPAAPGPPATEPNAVHGEDDWRGGFYELAIVIPADGVGSADALREAIRRCWAHRALTGPIQLEPGAASHPSVWAGISVAELARRLTGSIDLPAGRIPVATIVVAEAAEGQESEDDAPPALYWMSVAIPLGGLSRIYSEVGGYPFGDGDSSRWRLPVDAVLCDIASSLSAPPGYLRGYVGFEAGGNDFAAEGVPADRYDGVVVPAGGTCQFFAPTTW